MAKTMTEKTSKKPIRVHLQITVEQDQFLRDLSARTGATYSAILRLAIDLHRDSLTTRAPRRKKPTAKEQE